MERYTMKYPTSILILTIAMSTAVCAQSMVTVDTLDTTALESIPDLANIGGISPASTASRIILNASTGCDTAASEIQQAGYKVMGCTPAE